MVEINSYIRYAYQPLGQPSGQIAGNERWGNNSNSKLTQNQKPNYEGISGNNLGGKANYKGGNRNSLGNKAPRSGYDKIPPPNNTEKVELHTGSSPPVCEVRNPVTKEVLYYIPRSPSSDDPSIRARGNNGTSSKSSYVPASATQVDYQFVSMRPVVAGSESRESKPYIRQGSMHPPMYSSQKTGPYKEVSYIGGKSSEPGAEEYNIDIIT